MSDPCPIQRHWKYSKEGLIDFNEINNPVEIVQWLYDHVSIYPIGAGQREMSEALQRVLQLTKNRPRYDAHIHI